ncbi:hypothetical protein MNQ98_18425 [Paenibacillus sp. N3/727]|uniref:hypothetical protein n=1 Tax=Paenibacillus sp. N3/727 TaxID=2925845 RepID=UPI001F533E31|nr:hypothetical protein [Paenibacillus sp. N3/727]UNK16474.1 hypothetical protein MNQ98_18425 [Paenibacillus sp. N3/727]
MNYQIKYATRMKEVIFVSLVFSIIMFQIGVWSQQSFPVLFYAQMAVNVIMVIALIVELYARMVRRGVEIQSDSNVIRIHGEIIKAEDIEVIRVSGCRSAAFSLKLKEKKRPWVRSTFKFMDANCEGIREILKWAESNNIEVLKIGPQSPMVTV